MQTLSKFAVPTGWHFISLPGISLDSVWRICLSRGLDSESALRERLSPRPFLAPTPSTPWNRLFAWPQEHQPLESTWTWANAKPSSLVFWGVRGILSVMAPYEPGSRFLHSPYRNEQGYAPHSSWRTSHMNRGYCVPTKLWANNNCGKLFIHSFGWCWASKSLPRIGLLHFMKRMCSFALSFFVVHREKSHLVHTLLRWAQYL